MMCPQGLTKRILTQVLLQVLNVRQAALWMIQVGRQHDELLDYIAAQNGFPSHEQIVANIDEASFGHTWKRFWQYTDNINPYVSRHVGYVPIDKRNRHPISSAVALY